MASFIVSRHSRDNIILVKNGNAELASLYKDFLSALKGYQNDKPVVFKEVNYATESFQGITKKIAPEQRNIIVIFSSNRALVPNLVSLLNNYGKEKDIHLFGMPGWEEMDIETEFLINMDYHQVIPSFIDYDSEAVKQFIVKFRRDYGSEPLPENQAFLGYDIGCYFFQSLMQHGKDFGPCVRGKEFDGLQYDFSFRSTAGTEGYEHTSCKIVTIENYKWVLAK